jgi:hypothetical protein
MRDRRVARPEGQLCKRLRGSVDKLFRSNDRTAKGAGKDQQILITGYQRVGLSDYGEL